MCGCCSLREPRGQSNSAYHFLGTGITGEMRLQNRPTLCGNWECFLCGDSELLIWCIVIPFSFYGSLRTEGRSPLLDTPGLCKAWRDQCFKKKKSLGGTTAQMSQVARHALCAFLLIPSSKQFTFPFLSRMGHCIRFQACPQTGQAPLFSFPWCPTARHQVSSIKGVIPKVSSAPLQ